MMTSDAPSDRLKLHVKHADDLGVAAALLQDALIAIHDMAYLPKQKRFVAIANRFRWEQALKSDIPPKEPTSGDAPFSGQGAGAGFARIHCGLCVEHVERIRHRNIDRRQGGTLLNLLSLDWTEGHLRFVFSGQADLVLEAPRLTLFLTDLGEAWPTAWLPSHPS